MKIFTFSTVHVLYLSVKQLLNINMLYGRTNTRFAICKAVFKFKVVVLTVCELHLRWSVYALLRTLRVALLFGKSR